MFLFVNRCGRLQNVPQQGWNELLINEDCNLNKIFIQSTLQTRTQRGESEGEADGQAERCVQRVASLHVVMHISGDKYTAKDNKYQTCCLVHMHKHCKLGTRRECCGS
jgi:hypothetical protein